MSRHPNTVRASLNQKAVEYIKREMDGCLRDYATDHDDCHLPNQRLLRVYSEWVNAKSTYHDAGHHTLGELAYIFGGIAGEAGECMELIKKALRQYGAAQEISLATVPHLKLLHEMGDLFWYIQRAMNVLDYDIVGLAAENVMKLRDRAEERGEENI